jgi:DNA-binding IclR family transcriptional regulator
VRPTEAAERVVQVLELIAASPDGMGVTEVARELDVHKATASRLLATLAGRGMLERDPDSLRYQIGAAVVSLAAATLERLPVVSQARPELERLSAATGETVNLAILDGRHVVYVDQVAPANAVVMANWIGRRSPAYASSSGKVLLAFGSAEARETVLRGPFEPLTQNTLTDPAGLRRVLDETRTRGYARSSGELEDGLVTIAAPVLVDGLATAAVSVSGPVFRIPPRDQPRIGAMAVDAAAAVAARMSGRTRG